LYIFRNWNKSKNSWTNIKQRDKDLLEKNKNFFKREISSKLNCNKLDKKMNHLEANKCSVVFNCLYRLGVPST
jgi:hypothetical protein